MAFPKKKSSGVDILNQAADVVESKYAKKKRQAPVVEGSKKEEMSESTEEAAAEGDMPAGNDKRKQKLAAMLKAKGK